MPPPVYSGAVPKDVGGPSFPDGDEPDDDHRGGADEEFAAVVFDEDFVRAATVHEPSAVERLLAAAEARAEASEAEARRARARRRSDDDFHDGFDPDGPFGQEFDDDLYDPDLYQDGYGHRPRYGTPARWHRPVAWLLAMVMGVGMVALAFVAVYRGASSGRHHQVPAPTSTGVGERPGETPVQPSARVPEESAHSPGGTEDGPGHGPQGTAGTDDRTATPNTAQGAFQSRVPVAPHAP